MTPPIEAPKHFTMFCGLSAPFLLDAKAALLIDAKTGTLLYAFNEHERMQPASLSKARDLLSCSRTGYHLAATAQEGDMRLISVVLGARNGEKRRMESQKLLSWGFRTFATVSLDWRKDVPETLPVYGGEADQVAIAPLATPRLTVLKGHGNKIALTAAFPSDYLVAPVAKDATIGELTVTTDGNALAEILIKTQAAVGPGGFFKRIIDRIRLAWGGLYERTIDRIGRLNAIGATV